MQNKNYKLASQRFSEKSVKHASELR